MTSQPEVVLDLSRLISRVAHATPTGIDRVELAYARHLRARLGTRLSFAAVHPLARYYGRLDPTAVERFLGQTETRWNTPSTDSPMNARTAALRQIAGLRPHRAPRPSVRRIVVQASPHHLERRGLVDRILRTEHARLVVLMHDVIPITHPEFARPDGSRRHAARMATLDAHADGVLANSQATLDALTPMLSAHGGGRICQVAHLGHEFGRGEVRPAARDRSDRPYFLVLGTIEPRKNHLLLLNVWRRMVEAGDGPIPRLVIVGRRGWENEQVIDMLDRCAVLAPHVEEAGRMPDGAVASLIAGAAAVLLPSFAEGFGMPVAEALAAGVPVICSDLAALREVGGNAPDYLDPLDGLGWLEAIRAYAAPGSARARAQRERIAGWQPVRWDRHFDAVIDVIERVGGAAEQSPASVPAPHEQGEKRYVGSLG